MPTMSSPLENVITSSSSRPHTMRVAASTTLHSFANFIADPPIPIFGEPTPPGSRPAVGVYSPPANDLAESPKKAKICGKNPPTITATAVITKASLSDGARTVGES